MHPLNEGILRWINKGQYFWYLISVHKHWSIGVYGKQRCFYEVTGETSCHSFSQVPQLQNAVVLMRDCSSITVFFFFHNPEWETNSSPFKRWKHCEASTELEKQQQRLQQSRHPRNQHIIMVWANNKSRLEHGVRTPGRLGGFARHAKNLVLTPHPEMRQNVDVWQRSPNAHHYSGRFRRVQPDDYRCGNGLLAVLTRSVPGQK